MYLWSKQETESRGRPGFQSKDANADRFGCHHKGQVKMGYLRDWQEPAYRVGYAFRKSASLIAIIKGLIR